MRIHPQSGVAFKMFKGQTLTVVDPEGMQVSDLFCFDRHEQGNSLSSGRSIDYADSIFLTTGHQLYSQRSDVLFTILEDTCGRHDFLLTPCSLKMFQIVDESLQHHPSCHENLAHAFAPFDISPDQIGTTFNIFMNVTVARDGRIKIERPLSEAGDKIVLRAERDLLVGLTACSHEETNAGTCKPIDYFLAGPDSDQREFSPHN